MATPPEPAQAARLARKRLERFAKNLLFVADTLDRAAAALDANQREIAQKLVRSAADDEFDVLGECESTGRFCESLGLDGGIEEDPDADDAPSL